MVLESLSPCPQIYQPLCRLLGIPPSPLSVNLLYGSPLVGRVVDKDVSVLVVNVGPQEFDQTLSNV